jgi:hypothetical protein
MSIVVETLSGRRGIADWLRVPALVHADDPHYVRLPDFLEKRRISRRHAPFFSFGDAEFFIAYRDSEPVGRISAQVNRRHIETHSDATGHFGFFDCIDDFAVAGRLFDAAKQWLRGHGLSRMVGPVSFSLNEECGCLVEGFDTPPAILMPHHRPFTGSLVESAGLEKEIDLFAFRKAEWRDPERLRRIARLSRDRARIGMRPLDMKRYAQDLRLAFAICADAWSRNWGFVPFAEAEIASIASELRPFVRPDFLQFLTLDGREVGMMLVLPNVNEIVASQRPSPFVLLDLLRTYLTARISGTRTFRVALMGIASEHQATRLGGALMARLFEELLVLEKRYDPQWVEMSWILETNRPMLRMAQMMSGPPVKRYRIYGTDL